MGLSYSDKEQRRNRGECAPVTLSCGLLAPQAERGRQSYFPDLIAESSGVWSDNQPSCYAVFLEFANIVSLGVTDGGRTTYTDLEKQMEKLLTTVGTQVAPLKWRASGEQEKGKMGYVIFTRTIRR
jgi:hypothetical protein